MYHALKMIYKIFALSGIDPIRIGRSIFGFPKYVIDLIKTLSNRKSTQFGALYLFPITADSTEPSGSMSGHYFHQDLYVAQQIFKQKPNKHVDIGSRIDGFVAHVASFRPIEVLDIRANESHQKNIVFRQADLMEQKADLNEYADSVSCLHTIEHFGLGRYGDPIDIDGHLKGLSNIMSMVKKDGVFYFSTPIGPQRIEFNAHRVFSIKYLLGILTKGFELESFSYVDDKGDFHENIPLTQSLIDTNCGCDFGCGIFTLRNRSPEGHIR